MFPIMKKITLLPIIGLMFFAACKKDKINGNGGNNSRKADTLQGTITANQTLDASKDYFLKGRVYFKNNATLTIPAGITVRVQKNDAAADKSVLVITQGSKLFINGTAD